MLKGVIVESVVVGPESLALAREDGGRLERAVRENFQFVWRTLRRLGVQPDHAVDDAAQRVFEIAATKRENIAPGKERAFFFKVSLKVALEARRRHRVDQNRFDDTELELLVEPRLDPEKAAVQAAARSALDRLVSAMPLKLATVFVLYELEGLASAEIAALLDVPLGTVASRLRRARNDFRERAARLRSRLSPHGERR